MFRLTQPTCQWHRVVHWLKPRPRLINWLCLPNQKTTFAAGYDAFIIDMDKGVIVARASYRPAPSAIWIEAEYDVG